MNMQSRRVLLKQGGVLMALPFLPSINAQEKTEAPRRLVCIHQCLGWEPEAFFPKDYGNDVALSPTLQPLAPLNKKFTVFNGFEHGIKGGHFAEHTFLTGVHLDDAKTFKEGNISIDVKAAEHVGVDTRIPSLHLALPGGVGRYDRSSWTRSSVSVLMETDLDRVFYRIFYDKSEVGNMQERLNLNQNKSIIDAVLEQSQVIRRNVNSDDRRSLDSFFDNLRDTEKKIQARRVWLDTPKPKETLSTVKRDDIRQLFPLYYELMALALKTDSTRVATLQLPVTNQVYSDLGVKDGMHLISHHGKDPKRLEQLRLVEAFHMQLIANFLKTLSEMNESGKNLLDQTTVLVGAGMGNGSSHSNLNLPVLVAGGGFEHGGHRDVRVAGKPRQLCDLYVTLLKQFGLNIDSFGSSRSAYKFKAPMKA